MTTVNATTSYRPIDRSRFTSNVVVDANGCWIWQRKLDNDGYGRIAASRNGKPTAALAHRAAYETFVGVIPQGLELDHLCRVRSCVNPEHLEPVTHVENTRRADRGAGQYQAAKTHCPQGHPYDEANTYRPKPNLRQCRTCMRKASAAWKARTAAQKLTNQHAEVSR